MHQLSNEIKLQTFHLYQLQYQNIVSCSGVENHSLKRKFGTVSNQNH